MLQFLAIPRMHKKYSLFDEACSIEVFNPFNLFSINNWQSKSLNNQNSDSLKQDEYFLNTKQNKGQNLPLLNHEQALHYFADLKRISHEQVGVLSKEAIEYAQLENSEKLVSLPFASSIKFLQEEAHALERFYKENSQKLPLPHDTNTCIHEKAFNTPQEPLDTIKTSQKKEKFSRINLQKYLILAFLQEEQDEELFTLESLIAKQEQKVQSLLQNPLEKQYFSEKSLNASSESSLPLSKENLIKNLIANKEETLQSFAFNILKDKKNKTFSIKNMEKIRPDNSFIMDVQNFSYSTSWHKIFSAQIPFIQENTILFVNDPLMNIELLSLAKQLLNTQKSMENPDPSLKNNLSFRFYENIKNLHCEDEFLLEIQSFIKSLVHGKIKDYEKHKIPQKTSVFSYFKCPVEELLKKQTLPPLIGQQDLKKTLHFILSQK